jgi:hypothetical protein
LSLSYTNSQQCWIFLELIFVTVFYVETRGPTLEEIAKIFDGDEAEVANIDLETVEANVMTSGFEKESNVQVEHVGRGV